MTAIKSFPNPVLGNGDDIDGDFSYSLHYTLEPERIILDNIFSLSHETIEKMIADGSAAFVAEVICPATFFREVYTSRNPIFSTIIPSEKFRGQVLVSSFICTAKEVTEYRPSGLHPDLEGDASDLSAGEIVAVGEVASFIAEKDFDPLNAPVSSFMKIQKGAVRTGAMDIDYQSDKIVIILSQEDYAAYYQIPKKAVAGILHSSLVLPVLTDALHLMNNGSPIHKDQPWFAKLEQICGERNADISEPFKAAQQVLRLPLARGLRDIKDLLEME